jgi:outer membrane protein
MKRLFIILAVAGFFFPVSGVFGQNIKIGHTNSSDLMAAMPETDSAEATLNRSAEQLQTTFEELQAEYNKKYQDYLKLVNEPTTSSVILRDREDDLQATQTRVQNFQSTAQQDLQDQQARLLQPIQDKLNKALSDVGRENGFTYILDMASGIILYKADNSIDVTDLVKKKLGIQ